MKDQNNILIIGGPNVGKTHYGGQLYGRLVNKQGLYKITSPPENLIVFREVLDSLSEGKSAGRTHVSSNEQLKLEIEDSKNNKILFSFPDYGGEQIDEIVNERKVNPRWKENIDNSTGWMFFIRLDELKPIEDLVNRGIPEQSVLESRKKSEIDLTISPTAFYIELLQMLLYVKGVSSYKNDCDIKLTVVLSCWDNIDGISKESKPSEILEERLPLVKQFIDSIWAEDNVTFIGLSSTGKTLSNDNVDDEYIDKGPENFGYIVNPNGVKEPDLTLSISGIIG